MLADSAPAAAVMKGRKVTTITCKQGAAIHVKQSSTVSCRERFSEGSDRVLQRSLGYYRSTRRTRLSSKHGSSCCCPTLLAAFIIAAREDLWSPYFRVAPAAQLAPGRSREGA